MAVPIVTVEFYNSFFESCICSLPVLLAVNLNIELDAIVAFALVAIPELSTVVITPLPEVKFTLNSPVALAPSSVGIPEVLTFHLL